VLAVFYAGAFVVGVAFIAVTSALGTPAELNRRLLAPAAILVSGVALSWGARATRVRNTCSDPDCEGVPGTDDATCPGCGGTIAGTLRNANERLDAEEALSEGCSPAAEASGDVPKHDGIVRE
jgi:hypothetical protein